MKAVLSKVVGGPGTLVIEDIPAPELRPGWARVKVKAVGINFPDVLIIEDKYQSKPPRPFAPGGEVSGVVTEVAEGVTEVKVGDRVLAQIGHGGLVEEIAVGVHGLYIEKGVHSGLLLPQVATEQGWNRTEFLEYTCYKAGLPKDTWKSKDTDIYIFSADVF